MRKGELACWAALSCSLASCGSGTLAVVAGTADSSSGSTPALNSFVVQNPKTSPALLVLDASQAMRVALSYDAGDALGERPMQHLVGPTSNEVDLVAGVNPALEWNFASELGD